MDFRCDSWGCAAPRRHSTELHKHMRRERINYGAFKWSCSLALPPLCPSPPAPSELPKGLYVWRLLMRVWKLCDVPLLAQIISCVKIHWINNFPAICWYFRILSCFSSLFPNIWHLLLLWISQQLWRMNSGGMGGSGEGSGSWCDYCLALWSRE